ncbi:MAG: nucleoside hydrolase [Terracidiphilus sp.]|nr:nucleoside hydrolase [Terracidiphilus sp.]
MKVKNLRFFWIGFALAMGLVAGGLQAAGQGGAVGQAAAARQLVVLDTDIGDDIDDAFALGLLIQSPEVKLLGVTTAYGQTPLRAQLVERYLKAVGRGDVPVAAGVRGPDTDHFSQAAYARREPERQYPDGVAFLLEQIRVHPGQVTVVAIGALTNLRAALEREPETFRKVGRVVLMGGSVYEGYEDHKTGARQQPPSVEWNIRCDPGAARAVFESGVPVFAMPLDSTQIHLSAEELRGVVAHGSALTDQIALLYLEWTGRKEWRSPTLYDPVAVTYALRPELCPVKPMRLEVDAEGWTRPVEGKPNVQVCLKADEAGFRRFLLERLMGTQGALAEGSR